MLMIKDLMQYLIIHHLQLILQTRNSTIEKMELFLKN